MVLVQRGLTPASAGVVVGRFLPVPVPVSVSGEVLAQADAGAAIKAVGVSLELSELGEARTIARVSAAGLRSVPLALEAE